MAQDKSKKRKTIGLFADTTQNLYQQTMINGIMDAAVNLDYNLIIFVSHFSHNNKDRSRVEFKSIFDVALEAGLDGVVLFSEPILQNTNELFFEQLLKRMGNVPRVSIIYSKPGLHSVNIDNRMGFYNIIDHLIKVHNRKRIAFISGMMNSIDGCVRLEIYKEVLRDNHISLDEDLITKGDFWYPSGSLAVKTLLDERHVSFDAIVASNDYMAIDAANELTERGFYVGRDISVTGFDNIPDCINSVTEITTVAQPVYPLGYKSVCILDSLIKGEPVLENTILPTIPVIRKSCGCSSSKSRDQSLLNLDEAGYTSSIASIMNKQFEKYLPSELKDQFHCWADQLSEAITRCAREKSIHPFVVSFNALFVKKENINHIPLFIWNELFNNIFDFLEDTSAGTKKGFILEFFKAVQLLLHNYIQQSNSQVSSFNNNIHNALAFGSLYLEYTIPNFIASLKEQIEFNEIKNFFLSLKKDDNILFCFFSCLDGAIDLNPVDYPLKKIIPQGLEIYNRRITLIIGPVYYDDEYSGFIVAEQGYIGLDIHDHIANKISGIIKGIKLLDQIKDYSQNLEKIVEQRTADLKKTQEELLKTAKQAGMAEIAIQVLHNVGNILNPMNITCDFLKTTLKTSLTAKLEQANSLLRSNQGNLVGFFNDNPKGRTLVSYYERISEGLKDEQKIVMSQLDEMQQRIQRINDIIQKQQQYAVFYDLKAEFNLIQCIDNCLSILKTDMDQNRITIKKDFPSSTIKIMMNESKLFHVFLEILKNSIEAVIEMNQDDEKRIIGISIQTKADSLIINIGDSGIGIPSYNLSRIFSQYFTTKANHIGIGLHTSSIFMNELGGLITINSDGTGKGCDVRLIIPTGKV